MKTKIKMDLPNTYREFEMGDELDVNNVNPIVGYFMRSLICRLHRERPEWEFRSEWAHAAKVHTSKSEHTRFEIYDGDDKIGRILATTKYVKGTNVRAYEYENHRTANARRRGGATTTVSENKAFSDITNNFYSLTVPERISAAEGTLNSQLTNHSSKASRAATEAKGKLDKAILNFTMRRWKEFIGEVGDPELEEIARGFPKLARTAQQMAKLSMARTNGEGYIIVDRGERYIVKRTGEGTKALVIPAAELPDALRAGVGMLKLIEPNIPVVDVGIKASTSVYLIAVLGEEEEVLS